MPTNNLPLVSLVGTGGTIAAWGKPRLELVEYGGAEQIDSFQNLERIPEIHEYVQVQAEQYAMVGSGITLDQWLGLSKRINQIFKEDNRVSGVVVTHGTSVLEETAYWLNLTIKSEKPVVVTGTMRPPSALGTDADNNLFGALLLAGSSEAKGKGVLVMLNDEINAAREVTKQNSYRVETFGTRELGFLGYMDSDLKPVFYRQPIRKHTSQTEFDVSTMETLPWVDTYYAVAGGSPFTVDALAEAGVDGIAVAGTGGGYATGAMDALANAAKKGIAVVATTRAGAGRVIPTSMFRERGIIAGDNLSVQKARILLMLALAITKDRDEIQRIFDTY
ncbi:MAG: L-asparaginase [Chloroflexi bacterium]|jgi:L-asparaginase|nr:MAG: L-asparaginase [Chloroflexota bacterium]